MARAQVKGNEAGSVMKRVAGWSTKMLEEVTCRREVEDTEEMVPLGAAKKEYDDRHDEEDQAKGRMAANNSWWVADDENSVAQYR